VAENQPAPARNKHRMIAPTTLTAFSDVLLRSIANAAPISDDDFPPLALALFRLQFAHNAACRRWCEFRGVTPEVVSEWREIPAVPVVAFKEMELTSLAAGARTAVFHSSGTTGQKPSRHFHSPESLAVYEASLCRWFEEHLLAGLDERVEEQLPGPLDKPPFLSLTPPPELAPHSSLAHMFEVVRRKFGASDSVFAGVTNADGTWELDMDRVLFALRKSMCANRPVVLLGTAFNLVHLADHFAADNRRYRLAHGSRVLETGGYKGRSRVVPKAELHAMITARLGVPGTHIVTEYGMSEMSSQAYDRVAGGAGTRAGTLRFPPWCRALVVSPETGREVAPGETGLLRVFDLANVWSVMAMQTEDLAVRREDGFELLGRAAAAEPRGCSLMSLPGAEGREP
jgi:hypothetical protein